MQRIPIHSLGVALAVLVTTLGARSVAAQEEETPDATEAAATPDERAPAPPSAEDERLAHQFFETGRAHFERAEYERAAEDFQEAYRLSRRPELLVNVARSLEALGRDAEAVAALQRAIEQDEGLRSLAEPRLERLRAQIRRNEEEASAGQEAEQTDPAGAQWSPGALFWGGVASAGVGAGLLIAALGTGLASNDIYGDLQDGCPGGVCPPERRADIDRGNAFAVASTATLVIGAAAAVAGVILMLLDPGSAERPEPGAVEVTAGPGVVGLGVRAQM